MKHTLKELEKETCTSFGGNNCVLHGCIFNCTLRKAKEYAIKEEQNNGRVFTDQEIKRIYDCRKS